MLEGGNVPEPLVLRLSMVYGPMGKGNLLCMIDAVAKDRFLLLPEVGNTQSMVHEEDVAQAALVVAEKQEAAGQTYIVPDGQPYSTRQIYEWICKAMGKPIPNWHMLMTVLNTLAKVGDGIVRLRGRRFLFDSDTLEKLVGSASYSSGKIQREPGFRPLHNLQSALPDIIQYMG